MKPPRVTFRAALALGLFFFAMSLPLRSQPADAQTIRPLRWTLQETSLETRVEGQHETRSVAGSGARREDLTSQLSLGLDFRGSVYHPNLLEFRLAPKLGAVQRHSVRSGPAPALDSIRTLQEYTAEFTLLKQKPYATRAYAERGILYRDLDFFNRARVDSGSWGVSSGYNAGRVPVTVSYSNQTQDIDDGLTRHLHDRDENVALDATHTRGDIGQTKLTYQLNRFSRAEEGAYRLSGNIHNLSVTDMESWGHELPRTAQTALLYSRLTDNLRSEENLNLSESVSLQHRHQFRSSYRLAGHRRQAATDSSSSEAGITVAHQLFESLASQLSVDADQQSTHAPTSALSVRRVGTELAESYTKRLGRWGRLQAGFSIGSARENREASGQLIVVSDESHTLRDGTSSLLRQPNVIQVQFVTDGRGRFYTPQMDYTLVTVGRQMEIRRVAGGLIAEGTTVYVSYTAEAPRSGGYTTLSRAAHIRLELFDQTLAFYGRLNRVDNSGADFLVLQDIDDRVLGLEVKRGGLTLGAERETFFSTFASYRSSRLNESFTLDRGEVGMFTLDLTQTWIRLPDLARERRYQSYILRYRARPFPFLNCTVEGGYRRERGTDIDQLLATGRSSVAFDYGKLTFNAGYEYERESYLRDRHIKHFIFFYAKRRF